MARKKNKLLKQMELFDMISQKGLNPNQYYVLCSMRDSVTPLNVNLHLELRVLKSNGWVIEGDPPTISGEAHALIEKVEGFFKVQRKKTAMQLMGKDFKDKLKTYNEIFPAEKLPSGKFGQANLSNVETRMRWFFENHEYTWEQVHKATQNYVNEYQSKNWKYMRDSAFFIKKTVSGTVVSDLANYCHAVTKGIDMNPTPTFKTTVV